MKCLMLVTYSNSQEYIAIPCNSEEDAKSYIDKYIHTGAKDVLNTYHYDPVIYNETDDDVTLFYAPKGKINLDTEFMNCKIIIPGHGCLKS